MNHPVQQGLLQLELRERGRQKCQNGSSPCAATTPGAPAHLLHDIQLRVLRLKQLNEQLQDLGVQELVAGADL